MTNQTAATVVRRSVTVEAPIERAFAVFTEGYVTWAPKEHHLGEADLADVILEPRVGGRWFERGTDGVECDWGQVLAWDPPDHVAMSWHIGSLDGGEKWGYDPDPTHASRIDVRFTALGPSTTRVDLEHSELERHGEYWQETSLGVAGPNGWELTLSLYAKAI
jgi:hypothetical protein